MGIARKPVAWGLLAALLLAVLVGALAARYVWNETLRQAGIEELEWQGLDLSLHGVSVETLTLTQSLPTRNVEFLGRELVVDWQWPDWGDGWVPRLQAATAEYLDVNWSTKPGEKPAIQAQPAARTLPELPTWLPAEIRVQQFEASVPCETGQCPLSGSVLVHGTPTDHIKVQATLSHPWPVPGVGRIKGNLDVDLAAEQGQCHPQRLQADLELSHPAAWAQALPEQVQPESLILAIRSTQETPPAAAGSPLSASEGNDSPGLLPLNVSLKSHGGADVSVDSHLAVTTGAPWAVRLGKTQVEASLPQLVAGGWSLRQPRVRTTVSGWLDMTAASLTLAKPTTLHAASLSSLSESTVNDVSVANLNVRLAGASFEASYQQEPFVLKTLELSGPLTVKAGQVQHPQLQPQAWAFDGNLDSNLSKTHVKGLLRAGSGTTANLDVDVPYQGAVQLNGRMRVSGEDEAEALSRIFTEWPPLLDVSGGTVSTDVSFRQSLPQAKVQSPRVVAKLTFTQWSGLYDRTSWEGVNGTVDVRLQDEQLSIDTPELTVEQVNPGLPLGPLQLAGNYQAPLAQLSSGTLTFEQAVIQALGGEVHIQPGSWDLAQAPVTIPVELQQLSLTRLLQLYPAEGLAGTGILSGTVPVLFDPATGVEIDRGRIDALKPGGRLQLTAERLQALASQNETMKVVARALEDFHYSVLDSGINYDDDGTLVLSLHLKGRNPDVGDGRPVVLNINLEENIPALLKSLQLSGNVSERVKERVRKLLERRQQKSDD